MERTTSVLPEDVLNIFKHPARIIIAGFSNSGKSEICKKLIEIYHKNFEHILYCGVDSHSLQSHSEINSKMTVSSDILNPFDFTYLGSILFVLDDCFLEAVENKNVVDAFTKGRHKRISTVFITQNLFFSGKHARNIGLNCSHYILMRNRDLSQIEVLGRQVYGKTDAKKLVEVYKKALTKNTYGYLLIDLEATTPEAIRLRTNITGETPYQITFQW